MSLFKKNCKEYFHFTLESPECMHVYVYSTSVESAAECKSRNAEVEMK